MINTLSPSTCWFPKYYTLEFVILTDVLSDSYTEAIIRWPKCHWSKRQKKNKTQWNRVHISYINGYVQDCSNSIANALELLQSSTKPSIFTGLAFDMDELLQARVSVIF